MNVKSAWLPGENSTLRGVDGKVFWIYPTIVVQDSFDLITLYLPAGTVGKEKIRKPTPQQYLNSYKFILVDNTCKTTDA